MTGKKYLTWNAGASAKKHIINNGLNVDDIDLLVGASGGPKWLALCGLDRLMFGEWLPQRTRPLPLIGSSIGTWRFACLAQNNPNTAIDRFVEAYLQQRYHAKTTARDVSNTLNGVLRHLLAEQGVEEILSHPVFRSHIVAAKSRHLLKSEQRGVQALGLAACATTNIFSRNSLSYFFERILFADTRMLPNLFATDRIKTRYVELQNSNLEMALQASGSVPLVLEGVTHIPNSGGGVFRDGGITDYHFDQALLSDARFVLYPHFYGHAVPGWFDKTLKWRHRAAETMNNVLMISPSEHFLALMPFGKIPDRKDFFKMNDEDRVKFWKTVVSESNRLGDEFMETILRQDVVSRLVA